MDARATATRGPPAPLPCTVPPCQCHAIRLAGALRPLTPSRACACLVLWCPPRDAVFLPCCRLLLVPFTSTTRPATAIAAPPHWRRAPAVRGALSLPSPSCCGGCPWLAPPTAITTGRGDPLVLFTASFLACLWFPPLPAGDASPCCVPRGRCALRLLRSRGRGSDRRLPQGTIYHTASAACRRCRYCFFLTTWGLAFVAGHAH